MISLILGFLSSVVPKGIELFQDRQDKKHELALMDRQLEIQRQIAEERTKQVTIESDTRVYEADSSAFEAAIKSQDEAVKVDGVYNWVKSLNAAVRPFMGMCVVAVLITGLISVFFPAVAVAFNALMAVPLVVELILYIAGFFLGQRSISKIGK